MPYYRHTKETDPKLGESFETVVLAREGIDPKVQTVTFIPSPDEQYTWRQRERRRFRQGEYLPCPWFANGDYRDARPTTTDHYAHLALSHPGLLAYTPSEEHGVQDRQVRIKPGKYLEQFYKDDFTPEQIATYVAQCKAEYAPLTIARSEADIVAIYASHETGFTSCMQCKDDREYTWQYAFEHGNRPHPCAVYGESDLGVAYLGELSRVTARAVVWPDKKRYQRAYGDRALVARLHRAGYTEGSVIGARIRAIRHNGDWVMPYVDGCSYAELTEDKTWFVLRDGRTSYHTDTVNGYACGSDDDADNDDTDDNEDLYTCEQCDREYDYGNQQNGDLNNRWCDRCLDRSFVCDSCEARRFDDPTRTADGQDWCETCIDGATQTCEHPTPVTRSGIGYGTTVPCDETWCEQVEFTPIEAEQRTTLGTSHLCRSCAGLGTDGIPVQVCRSCAHLFDSTEPVCPVCGMAVRCAFTRDLIATIATRPIREPRHDLPSTLAASAWDTIDIDTRCYIATCHTSLPAGSLVFRADHDLPTGEPLCYCRDCSGQWHEHYNRPLPPVPVASMESPF